MAEALLKGDNHLAEALLKGDNHLAEGPLKGLLGPGEQPGCDRSIAGARGHSCWEPDWLARLRAAGSKMPVRLWRGERWADFAGAAAEPNQGPALPRGRGSSQVMAVLLRARLADPRRELHSAAGSAPTMAARQTVHQGPASQKGRGSSQVKAVLLTARLGDPRLELPSAAGSAPTMAARQSLLAECHSPQPERHSPRAERHSPRAALRPESAAARFRESEAGSQELENAPEWPREAAVRQQDRMPAALRDCLPESAPARHRLPLASPGAERHLRRSDRERESCRRSAQGSTGNLKVRPPSPKPHQERGTELNRARQGIRFSGWQERLWALSHCWQSVDPCSFRPFSRRSAAEAGASACPSPHRMIRAVLQASFGETAVLEFSDLLEPYPIDRRTRAGRVPFL